MEECAKCWCSLKEQRPMIVVIFLAVLVQSRIAAAGRCGGILSDPSGAGVVSSPNYPEKYNVSSLCIWVITCPSNSKVELKILDIDIESDKLCSFDYLQLRDGPSNRSPSFAEDGKKGFCGKQLKKQIFTATGNTLWMKFASDEDVSFRGFQAFWKCIQIKVITKPPVQKTSTSTTGISSTSIRTGIVSFGSSSTLTKGSTVYQRSTNRETTRKDISTKELSTRHFTTGLDHSTQHVRTKGPTVKPTDFGNGNNFCFAEFYKGISWNTHYRLEVAESRCPQGMNGIARRKCMDSKVAKWSDFVDMSSCTSAWMSYVDALFENPIIAAGKAVDAIVEKYDRGLTGGDIVKLDSLMENLRKKAVKKDFLSGDEAAIDKLFKGFVNVGSKALDSAAWNTIPEEMHSTIAANILKNMEKFALSLSKVKNGNTARVANSSSVVAIAKAFPVKSDKSAVIIDESVRKNIIQSSSDWSEVGQVEVPAETIKEVAGNNKTCYTATIISRNSARFLKPRGKGKNDKFINSLVISMSLSPAPQKPFTKPIIMTNKHLRDMDPSSVNTECSYWKTNFSGSHWSQEGVVTGQVTKGKTICVTYHLTSFAVLMQTHRTELTSGHRLALRVITQVGISVSLIGLILSFLVFVTCKSLQSTRNTIHKNLTASLGIAYAIFIVGISRTENKIVCTVFAAILYYFLLVAFLWMLMEGVQLYILLVQVFPRESFKRHYYIICWGIPLVLTGVGAGAYPNGFGNATFCWLSVQDKFIWFFTTPVLFVVVVNSIFLVLTFRIIIRNSAIMTRDQNMRKSVDKINYWAKGSLGLVPLLGVTWLFGVLYVNEDSVVMAYLFNICNAFQGLYIFAFYCLFNDKVKEEFKRRLCSISFYSHSSTSVGKARPFKNGNTSRNSMGIFQMPWAGPRKLSLEQYNNGDGYVERFEPANHGNGIGPGNSIQHGNHIFVRKDHPLFPDEQMKSDIMPTQLQSVPRGYGRHDESPAPYRSNGGAYTTDNRNYHGNGRVYDRNGDAQITLENNHYDHRAFGTYGGPYESNGRPCALGDGQFDSNIDSYSKGNSPYGESDNSRDSRCVLMEDAVTTTSKRGENGLVCNELYNDSIREDESRLPLDGKEEDIRLNPLGNSCHLSESSRSLTQSNCSEGEDVPPEILAKYSVYV